MSDDQKNPAHENVQTGPEVNQPARPRNAEKIQQKLHDVKEGAEHPGETVRDVAERVTSGARSAPGKIEQSVFRFDSEYGTAREKTIVGAVQLAREKVEAYKREHYSGAATVPPQFSSRRAVAPKKAAAARPPASVFRYGGVAGSFNGSSAQGRPNFGIGQHQIDFGAGSAVPYRETRGSARPTTGTALPFERLHNFGAFGGGLNFTRSIFEKNRASKKKEEK
jgi:hypothetical protein